jgi:hypothetical protein
MDAQNDNTAPSRSALDRPLFFRNEWVYHYRHPRVLVGLSFTFGTWNLFLGIRALHNRKWLGLLPLTASAAQFLGGYRLYQIRVGPRKRPSLGPTIGSTGRGGWRRDQRAGVG